jgi:hypothetical protein
LFVGPATADCGDSSDVKAETNGYYAQSESTPCQSSTGGQTQNASSTSGAYYTSYRDRPVCFIRSYWGNQSGGCPASAPDTCLPGETLYEQQGLHNGQWESLGQFCRNDTPGAVNPPQVTPADVARAFQRIPLPALRAKTQPADKTLINFDTIFYVEAAPLHRTLTLLGQRVELEITPSTFRWVHGDGTTAETTTPGAAYPAKVVVYRYQQAHVTVQHHVEVMWTARWSLNGGPYQDVAGTVTTVGPDTPLRVAEATPALSGYGH